MASNPFWKAGVTLALVAAFCTALVAFTWQQTAQRIEANNKAWLEHNLHPALGDLFFDSPISDSMIVIPAPHDLPGTEAATVYRIYDGENPVAALFVVSTTEGYAGPIQLLIGIGMDGTVTGVRVLVHRETPGLGDRIEISKSDWVLQFDGHSLTNPMPMRWTIRRDGGDFDQLTGASITPRAIVAAIKETLSYFNTNRTLLFAPEAQNNKPSAAQVH